MAFATGTGALQELLQKKQKGQPIAASKKSGPSNVINLMDALKASLKSGGNPAPETKPAKTTKKTPKPRRKTG